MPPGQLHLNVAGQGFDLQLPDPALRHRVASRYGSFLSPLRGPAHHPVLRYERAGGDLATVQGPAAGRLDVTLTGSLLRVGPAQHPWAWLDRSAGTGGVVAHASMLALDVLVRAAVALAALEAGGCCLHAAAVELDGQAHLFVGPSGVGKSTVAQHLAAEGARVLADEFVVVLPDATGRMHAHGTPFWTGAPASSPIHTVWALDRSQRGVQRRSTGQALRLLVGNLSCPIQAGMAGMEEGFLAAAASVARQAQSAQLGYGLGERIAARVATGQLLPRPQGSAA